MSDQMCLAVLPILTLLLLGLRHYLRARAVHDPAARALFRAQGSRAPPPHLTPSLSKLCVLRV